VSGGPPPFVLTLGLDAASQAMFERLRRRHFPAKLNRVPAHITLFHALPGEEGESIRSLLASVAATHAPFAIDVSDVKKLGRGVAYALAAGPLHLLHAELRTAWLPWLTAQDAQPFRPHVVIQNKVDPASARALYDELAAGFRPWSVRAESLLLWRYLGGPWSLEAELPFWLA
jgi:2'-5' RNA ligase